MHKPRIGIMRGGPSSEHEVSVKSGASVLSSLREKFAEKYHARDIFIDREGQWHLDGIPTSIEKIAHSVDVVFNALHGSYGEDGKVQSLLEIHQIPFTGSGSLGSAIGMNKSLAKKIFTKHGIKTPRVEEVQSSVIKEDVKRLVEKLFQILILPVVVKPASAGSSVGVSIVKDYRELGEALMLASDHGDIVLLEEYIPGIEATCGVIQHFRGQELYALPPVEIRSNNQFFDYEAKYQGKSEEIVPATFSHELKQEIQKLAQSIHRALGLRHYSRSDFIIHPRRGIYTLEVNTLPGLTEESLLPKSLRAVGSDMHELVEHLVELARRK